MMKIQHEGRGFSIVCKEGGLGTIRCFAESADEAAEVVRHYYGNAHRPAGLPECPLCRQMLKEERRT